MGKVIGIDLGYSSSRIGYVDEFGICRVVPSFEGTSSTPSVVYFKMDGSVIVGQLALEMSFHDPDRSVRFCKNYLGDSTYTMFVDDKEYSMKDIASFILQDIVSNAEIFLGNTIDGAIISCSSYFGEAAKKDMIDAVQSVVLSNGNTLQVLNVMPDTHAIAIAYNNAYHLEKNKNLLIYDLGGGSFDCAVVTVNDLDSCCDIKTLTIGGDHMLGAIDWDQSLINYILEKYCDLTGEDLDVVSNDPDMLFWLYNTADLVKRKLSHCCSVSVYPSYGGKQEEVVITRELFETMTESYLSMTIRSVNEMVNRAQLAIEHDIDDIVLVGGGARMPQVWKRLEQEYHKTIVALDMEFAVVKGLALSEKILGALETGGCPRCSKAVGKPSPEPQPRS